MFRNVLDRNEILWAKRLNDAREEKLEKREHHPALSIWTHMSWLPLHFKRKCFRLKWICERNRGEEKECRCECLFCGKEGGNNGVHLLKCSKLIAKLPREVKWQFLLFSLYRWKSLKWEIQGMEILKGFYIVYSGRVKKKVILVVFVISI